VHDTKEPTEEEFLALQEKLFGKNKKQDCSNSEKVGKKRGKK